MEFKNTWWIIRFYRYIMPNGIFQNTNAVRHDISVAK